jgi:predicted nucleotidyltransferase
VNETRIVEVQLHRAATLLEPILDRMVFTGGAIRGLLVTDPAVDAPRPTDDIDTIVEVSSLAQYHVFELELRKLGFKNDIREDAPICRYVHGTLTLDVMPTGAALGFSNPWYPHAHHTAVEHVISPFTVPPVTIRVISATCFIATKLVSYLDRGHGDPYHRDVEDIIVVVDGRPSLFDELKQEAVELRRYVGSETAKLLANGLEQHIPLHLSPDAASQARFSIVLGRLRRISREL